MNIEDDVVAFFGLKKALSSMGNMLSVKDIDATSAEIKLGDHSHEIIATIATIKTKPTCLVFLYSG